MHTNGRIATNNNLIPYSSVHLVSVDGEGSAWQFLALVGILGLSVRVLQSPPRTLRVATDLIVVTPITLETLSMASQGNAPWQWLCEFGIMYFVGMIQW